MGDHSQGPRHFHHLLKIVRNRHPGQGKNTILKPGISRQTGGVTDRGPCPGGTLPSLQDNDRFGRPGDDLHQPPPPRNRFQIQGDCIGLGIADEILEYVALIHIRFVADGTGLPHTDGSFAHQIRQKPGREHPALNDQ